MDKQPQQPAPQRSDDKPLIDALADICTYLLRRREQKRRMSDANTQPTSNHG